jgi:hypothetical protein
MGGGAWAREPEGRIFDRCVEARPPSDGEVLGGPEQLGGWAIDLGCNENDRTAVLAAERQNLQSVHVGAWRLRFGCSRRLWHGCLPRFRLVYEPAQNKDWEKENRGRQSDEE